MKYLGIDYGSARIGVAVSDALGITARGIETISWNGRDWEKPLERIVSLLRQEGAEGIVMGLPKRTDGQEGESAGRARQLAALLEEATGIVPILRDERFTTVMATRVLQGSSVKKKNRRSVIDQVAAEIILKEFLESRRGKDAAKTDLPVL